jgi:hypothetical protein
MRLWSIHPVYLDAKGLVACWREALLAQKVLEGTTRGYTRHPQLERFRAAADPRAAIGFFLRALADEAESRGYRFDCSKIISPAPAEPLPVTQGQIEYELALLRSKVFARTPAWLETPAWRAVTRTGRGAGPVRLNPSFRRVPGGIESWERVKDGIIPSR